MLKARLADARFFWEEDQKIKLEDYLPRLEKVVFQESLGTVAQKTERVKTTVSRLAERLGLEKNTAIDAGRAAFLAKTDLVTNMVYEFPELQGIMGRYYALLSGEKEVVAQAILEHYQPRFAGDVLPSSLAGALVSIADKMDTLAGCFAIGIEPTGSQDPYALRRQAMGICLILLEQRLELSLDELIKLALENYQGIVDDGQLGQHTVNKIKEFFRSRLKNILSDKGHRYDVIEAVLAVEDGSLLNMFARADALSGMKDNQKYQELLRSFTRAYNLAKKKEAGKIDPTLFEDETEKVLYAALEKVAINLQPLEEQRDYHGVIRELSNLAEPINNFFTAVLVMVEEPKVQANRLRLLGWVVALSQKAGDLSKIVL